MAGERLVPLTESTLAAADACIAGLEARGGTNLEVALEAALALPVPADRPRLIMLLTDGGAAAREAALTAVRQGLGIGTAVDGALLERLALAGRGTVEFLTPEEDIEGAIIRLQDRLSHPVLTDLEIVWEGAEAVEVFPSRLPDLFVGQPVTLIARLRPQTERPRVRIRGRRGEETVELDAPLTPGSGAGPLPALGPGPAGGPLCRRHGDGPGRHRREAGPGPALRPAHRPDRSPGGGPEYPPDRPDDPAGPAHRAAAPPGAYPGVAPARRQLRS